MCGRFESELGKDHVSVKSIKGLMTLVYRALNRETGCERRGRNTYCVGTLSLNENVRN